MVGAAFQNIDSVLNDFVFRAENFFTSLGKCGTVFRIEHRQRQSLCLQVRQDVFGPSRNRLIYGDDRWIDFIITCFSHSNKNYLDVVCTVSLHGGQACKREAISGMADSFEPFVEALGFSKGLDLSKRKRTFEKNLFGRDASAKTCFIQWRKRMYIPGQY